VSAEMSDQGIGENQGQNGVEGNDEDLSDSSIADQFGQERPPGSCFVAANLITARRTTAMEWWRGAELAL
jgi:hypothetical protein